MSRKKLAWTALDDANLKASVRRFQSIGSELRDHCEAMEKVIASPSLDISSDDLASLIVSIRNASALLQVMISAKQLQELKAENDALKNAQS